MTEKVSKLLGHDITKQLIDCIGESESDFKNVAYELYYEMQQGKTKKDILEIIKMKTYGFGHVLFDDTRKKQDEQDGFIEHPFDVAEGIFKCVKCEGTKTYSYSKQVRSCDEGMSVFVTCVKCKHKWMHSG